MGKFPAPLLMSTVHFAMQAVLSTAMLVIGLIDFAPTLPCLT
jgi:hypothetical protein